MDSFVGRRLTEGALLGSRALTRSMLVTAVAIALSCAPRTAPPASTPGPAVSVQLLAINDFHGHLEPPAGSNGRIGSTEVGGAEYLATHLRQALKDDPHSIIVAAGDLIGASPLMSAYFHDEPSIETMNAMGLAVSTVGNHEFDEGPEELLRMKRGGCHPKDGCRDGDGFDGARFDYLSANVVSRTNGQTLFPPVAVRTIGGVRIGFIGVTTRETASMVPASTSAAFEFRDEADVANAQAAALEQQGVHAIVLLIHEGLRQRPGGEPIDPNGCASPSGGLDHMLDRLSADIAVVVSGHTHAYYNCRIGSRLVTSAGAYGQVVTRIHLQIDAGSGRIKDATATNEIVTRTVARDSAITAIIDKYAPLVKKMASERVGSITADLRHQANAAGESPLGDVIADAQLEAASSAENGSAVVAFMNSGGIRADVAFLTTPAERGQVTFNDLYNVQPFGNTIMTFTLTGDMIKRLLEEQFNSEGRRSILQVSRGLTYRYRLNAPVGQHIEAGSIMLNRKPIASADRIRVAAVDFLITSGDGFTVFRESTERQLVGVDIDALVAYFKKHSPIAPPATGRIVRVD